MDENHQGKTGSKLSTTEDNIWLPPVSPNEQKKVERLQKKPFAERMGVVGKTFEDFVRLLLIPIVLATVGFGFTLLSNQMAEAQRQDAIL